MTKKVGVGKAHSKIILMGEHSVVYGHPALALPLKDIEVVCQIQAAETPLMLKAQDPLTTAIFSALNYLEIKNTHYGKTGETLCHVYLPVYSYVDSYTQFGNYSLPGYARNMTIGSAWYYLTAQGADVTVKDRKSVV